MMGWKLPSELPEDRAQARKDWAEIFIFSAVEQRPEVKELQYAMTHIPGE